MPNPALSRYLAVAALRRLRHGRLELYLAWSEAGFLERRPGDVQVLLAKPGYRAAADRAARATAFA